jgi:hypothetical protein
MLFADSAVPRSLIVVQPVRMAMLLPFISKAYAALSMATTSFIDFRLTWRFPIGSVLGKNPA